MSCSISSYISLHDRFWDSGLMVGGVIVLFCVSVLFDVCSSFIVAGVVDGLLSIATPMIAIIIVMTTMFIIVVETAFLFFMNQLTCRSIYNIFYLFRTWLALVDAFFS